MKKKFKEYGDGINKKIILLKRDQEYSFLNN